MEVRAMIRPVALSHAHMECRSLTETLPPLTDLLGFERAAEGPDFVTLKHVAGGWDLVIHEAGPDAPAKQRHNHFGVRVATNPEIDAAFAYISAHGMEYGLSDIVAPAYSHGSYSLYFLEPGTNGMEIECYEVVNRKESGTLACGDVAISQRFYEDVLGLQAHRAYPQVVYVKHPETKHYMRDPDRNCWEIGV